MWKWKIILRRQNSQRRQIITEQSVIRKSTITTKIMIGRPVKSGTVEKPPVMAGKGSILNVPVYTAYATQTPVV